MGVLKLDENIKEINHELSNTIEILNFRIDKVKKYGLNMDYLGKKIIQNEFFTGKTFVLTGSLVLYTREEAKEIIESFGGKTSESVSKKTNAVIVGENPGKKYEKAKELNIPILTEKEFKDKIESI